MSSTPPPTPLRPALQILLGFITGLAVGGLMAVIGVLRIPINLAGWLAIFAVIWVAVFFALRKNLAVLVVIAFLTTGLISLFTSHLFDAP